MIDLSKMGLGDLDLSILPPAVLGRLTFELTPAEAEAYEPGLHALGQSEEKDSYLFVPETLAKNDKGEVPLLVMFHGANGSMEKVRPFLQKHAEEQGFLLLLPQSTFPTWDLTVGGNGPDLARLEAALIQAANHFTINPQHFGFCGFSDGASYSLSIGISNGDLLSHVIVMSGGFMNVYKPNGQPRVFIAHSPEDEQLPIDTSGRKHAAMLKNSGYDVIYHEFHGPHVIHPDVVEKAIDFFVS